MKLIVGDPSLPPPEDPVPIFLTLFTKEAEKQAQDKKLAADNLVDDSQCRR
ncbi:MAG TPA: hypothetical protein VNN06_09240 [Ramlibacter sp.]|nr:hypothetical protein [Ramlibacter sp.]